MKSPFEIFLLELAEVLNFPNLLPDEQGACLIVTKENLTPLLFEFDDQLVPYSILLSSPLLPLSVEHRLDLLEEILKGNSTIEETLSCKPDEEIIYLHRRIHPEIQSEDLEKILDSFIKQAELWINRIEEIKQRPSRPEEGKTFPFSIPIFPDET